MNKLTRVFFIFSGLFFLTGCSSGYLSVDKIKTDKVTYASRFARTPDPRSLNPPKGEKLYITWSLPLVFEPHMYRLKADFVYRNLTTETIMLPLKRRAGSMIIEMLGEEYKKKEGYLSYKMEIISVDGEVISDYTHRMWVDLILPCGVKK
ncbi:MAG: hypothetical protein S4CHLAM20_10060 [Chlamydiia bacterium]|nr:hypothetical protein [Chlamydiia bacterium]